MAEVTFGELKLHPDAAQQLLAEAKREMFANIRLVVKDMTGDERVEFFREVREGFCEHCGTDHLPCHCRNDE